MKRSSGSGPAKFFQIVMSPAISAAARPKWKSRADEFRALFTPGRKIRPLLDRAQGALDAAGKTIIAIHLRRADFGYGRFWIAPVEWYLAWLRTLWPKFDQPVLYIATDDEALVSQFAEFSPWDLRRIGGSIPGADFMIDHHILRHADHVAISNSTFSFTAAMLNGRAVTFMRPHPNRRELIDFDPWCADVLLDPVIEHDQITEAQRTILESQFRPDDVVVHVGQHCSPWTNLARSLRPSMRIHELGEGRSIDEFRRQQGGGRVRHLVAENFASLARTLAGASASLSRAGVQMVHFRIPPEGDVPALPDELKRGGYRLFVSLNGSLKPADADVPLAPGCYVAVQERVATSLALSGRAAP